MGAGCRVSCAKRAAFTTQTLARSPKPRTEYNVKIVISNLDIQETSGLYQVNDVKIILDPVQMNYIYITEQDYFEVPNAFGTTVMKVIEPRDLPRRQPGRLRDHREAAVMPKEER